MTQIRFDESLRSKIDLTAGTAELCDEAGKPVAYVLSAEEYRKLVGEWVKRQYDDEQAARAWDDYQHNGGVPTPEAWARVEQRLKAREGAA